MSDGLDFMMELEAKLDGAQAMVRELKKVQGTAEGLDKHLKDTEKHGSDAFRKLTGWTKEFGKAAASSFTGMFAAEAVWDSMKEGGRLLVDLTEEMFKAAGEAERTGLAFRNMLGDDEGSRLLDYVDKLAKQTEFTDGPLKGFAQSLLDAGFAGDDLSYAMAAVADVAARTPDKMAGAANAIGALERIMLTGTTDARALRALKISPRSLFDQMAKDLGLGSKTVEKKLQEGKIKTADVLNSVYKAMTVKSGKALGAVGADMAGTFAARLEKVKDLPSNLFQELEHSKGFRKMSGVLDQVAESFNPDSPAGQRLIGGMEKMIDGLGDMAGKIDFPGLAESIGTAFERLPPLIDATTKALIGIGKAIGWVTGLAGDTIEDKLAKEKAGKAASPVFDERSMTERFLGIPGSIKMNLHLEQIKAPAVPDSPSWLDKLFGIDQSVLDRARRNEAQREAQEMGAAVPKGLAEGIKAGTPGAILKTWSMMDDVVGAGEKSLGIHSPSRVFAEMGRQSAAGFAQGLELRPPSVSVGTFMDGVQAPGGAATGPVTINAPVTVNVDGSKASAEEIGKEVAGQVAAELQSQLEQLAVQSGAAYG